MRVRSPLPAAAAALLCFTGTALACAWDYDTLEMERQRFPDVLEVIAGKVLRHSRAFYEWRARDRERRLVAAPDDLRLLDDLTIAYDKLGRRDDAIATARRSERLAPRRYETLANLGTVLAHAGRFDEALPALRTAIQINPEAHFGRERYQIALIEYVVARAGRPRRGLPGTGPLLPLQLDAAELELTAAGSDEPIVKMRSGGATGFAEAAGASKDGNLDEARVADAVKGVCGMLVFGSNDSPILLEALGDLLSTGRWRGDGQRLAARAYLRASRNVEEPARATYRRLAAGALNTQWKVELPEVEAELEAELEEGRTWLAGIEADEAAWIAAGEDPEAAFARKYYTTPQVGPPSWIRAALDLPGR